ncbi:MAG: hypothetical protein KAR54_00255 [Candidatus Pacebacteria bacterium]|nr:hypothetical protein [Candidatus Paceibacterota bacterium]
MNSLKIIEKKQDNDLYLSFFRKKTERVVSALYLITNHFSDDEILKWKLRKQGIQLLSYTMSLNRIGLSNNNILFSNIENNISEIISYLDIALIIKIISDTNIEVFKRELNFLLSLITKSLQNLDENSLPKLNGDYFKVKDSNLRNKEVKLALESIKDNYIDKGQFKGQTPLNPKKIETNKEKKSSRRDKIIKLLDKGQELTIKDIMKVFDDCSEKTIQRELQVMLKESLLKKEGERRWSRYSMKI